MIGWVLIKMQDRLNMKYRSESRFRLFQAIGNVVASGGMLVGAVRQYFLESPVYLIVFFFVAALSFGLLAKRAFRLSRRFKRLIIT